MTTYSQLLYQIVFGTRHRKRTLSKNTRDELYKYIWGVLEHKKCNTYRIGGVEDHIHSITHINTSISIASLVKDIKLSSTDFIKQNKLFPNFDGWQNGYGVFSYAIEAKEALIEYVKNQEVHHAQVSFEAEYRKLIKENGVVINDKCAL